MSDSGFSVDVRHTDDRYVIEISGLLIGDGPTWQAALDTLQARLNHLVDDGVIDTHDSVTVYAQAFAYVRDLGLIPDPREDL